MQTQDTSRVPVEPLRRAFLDAGMDASEVARRLGWHGRASERVESCLGIQPPAFHATLYGPRAERIAEVLGVDFEELYGVTA